MSELVAAAMTATSSRGDLKHVGIDVDKLDTHIRERVEYRGREASGPGSEIDDEASGRDPALKPMDDGREHAVVVRDELADRLVVVVGRNA
jgi:hypothetical protein